MSRWLQVRTAADRVVAALLLVAASPVILVAGALVRAHDRGPALIAVPRTGRGGVTFGMWKLRSMVVGGTGGRAGGAALTTADDSRITPIGARLRAYHLDELPQLYNVVRGEMALLGPRPEDPAFVDLTDPAWEAVLAVAPGIAGPTQLVIEDWERDVISAAPDGSAYRDEVLPVKLAIDRWYVGAAAPGVDLLVVAELLRHVIGGGAPDRLVARVRAAVPEAARATGPS